MSTFDWQKVKAIFATAVDLPMDERASFLSNACAGDESLCVEVEKLLNAYRSEFMEAPLDQDSDTKRAPEGMLIGRYEVLSLIGSGGMGKVYLAKDSKLDRKVAIKVLNEEYGAHESDIQRFIQEAKAASALNHPNILVIHEIGETADSHYIVSEYVEGKTLREVLNERKLSVQETVDIAAQVANALAAAHAARIIHRDIKPENIVIRNDGYVKVLDFGLAKLIPPSFIGMEDETIRQNQTAAGLILGTVSYMSPEQAKGEPVDERTDMFSLGVVIYEMLTGRTPFAAATMSERFANLINKEAAPLSLSENINSHNLEEIILKMLSKDRSDRFQTMSEVIAGLKMVRSGMDSGPVVVPSDQRTIKLEPQTTRRSSLRWSLAEIRPTVVIAGLLIFAAAVLAVLSFRNWTTSQGNATGAGRSRAYDLYMRGKVKVLSHNRDEVEGAIKLLEQAVSVDPNYAEAYAALAQAYNTKAFFQSASQAERKQIAEDADVAVEKALALNPNLAEGHLARGLVLWTQLKRFPHELSIQSLKRSIALNPNIDEAHHWLGVVYFHVGLLDEAEQEIKKALDINPNNTVARFRVGTIAGYEGRYEDAVAVFKTIPRDVSPWVVDRATADALVHLGRFEEANALVDDYLKKYPQDEGGNVTSVKAILLAKAGKQKEAEETIRQAIDAGTGFGHFHHTAYNIASAYAIMGRREEAMKWLQNAADDGFPNYTYFSLDRNLDNLHSFEPFNEFMQKLKSQMERFRSLASKDYDAGAPR